MQNSLEGITVVAVEQAVAAPYASSRLADAGARVIKVERPEGDLPGITISWCGGKALTSFGSTGVRSQSAWI